VIDGTSTPVPRLSEKISCEIRFYQVRFSWIFLILKKKKAGNSEHREEVFKKHKGYKRFSSRCQ